LIFPPKDPLIVFYEPIYVVLHSVWRVNEKKITLFGFVDYRFKVSASYICSGEALRGL